MTQDVDYGAVAHAEVARVAVKWRAKPAPHDFVAARSYLSLNFTPGEVERIVTGLLRAKTVKFKAKDLLRATRLPLLPESNPDVKKELDRIASGQTLSPCLMVRGRLSKGRLADIADGYHRICASNYVDEDAEIPVRLIGL